MTQSIVLDTDPGHDDAVAMLVAAASDALTIEAVTTVAGNQTIDHVTENALKVLELADRTDIPVARGAERPLVREQVIADQVHGESGLDGHEFPTPQTHPVDDHAVEVIINAASNGDLMVVPVGPLTNVAMALRRAPDIVDSIDRIVLMGGAAGDGNITPAAEFNIWADPHAASIVFNSPIPVTMVGLDVTHQARLNDARLDRIRAIGDPVGTAVADLFEFYRQFHEREFGNPNAPVHDAVAVAQVIDPDLIATEHCHVDVELTGELTRGRTVVDRHNVTDTAPNTDVGFTLDTDRFYEMLFDTLESYAQPQ